MNKTRILWLSLILLSLSACSGGPLDGLVRGPTPMPGAAQTPLPDVEVNFSLNPPLDTAAGAEISLELLDPVTGVGYNGQRFAMSLADSGQWQVTLELPLGSLVRYRYLLLEPEEAVEHDLRGRPVNYRVGYLPSPIQFLDQVASWKPNPAAQSAGRIIGQVLSAADQRPVAEMIVSAGGQQTFTDGLGRFRLEGLAAGLNNLVAYHPSGAFRTVQQGAIVAEGGTTPAEFKAEPAEEVTMTFQVEVPAATPNNPSLRLVGNLSSLGDMFTNLAAGEEISGARAPELVPVDDSHYLLLAKMYAGTDLRYKYTLGDGLWNAERNQDGSFRTRQLIIPETDAVQSDSIASWREAGDPITIRLEAPANTPTDEIIGLQFDPFTRFEPLPMTPDGDSFWTFSLWSPHSIGQSMNLHLCRNLECGRAEASEPVVLDTDAGVNIEQPISSWQWWSGPQSPPTIISPGISSRSGMRMGVDLAPRFQPTWVKFDQQIVQRVSALGANSLTLSPVWLAESANGTPLLTFDPAYDRFQIDWLTLGQRARSQGLQISLRPELLTKQGTLEQWWQQGARDSAWWTTANEELSSFLLSQAKLAEAMAADRFILTGSQLAPALPGGRLADGQPANQPLTAETYWRQLLEDIRNEYSGNLVFELELAQDLATVPPFIDEFDSAQIYWHAPLAESAGQTVEMMQQEAARQFELELLPALPEALPLTISAEYLSIEGSELGCPRTPGGSCRDAAEFDAGASVDSDLNVDLDAQSSALNALLLEVDEHERIVGFSVRRFYPLALLQDKSASIHGKPAADLIRYWYSQWQSQ